MPTDEELAISREITEFDRTLAVFEGKEMVATAGIFSYEMTVPGGTLPCGGVTRVSVVTTHRRRGLLTAMMRRQLDDMHERGEPLAALYASEAPIYGRFGYGLSTYQAAVDIDRSHGAFANKIPAGGRLSMVDVPTGVREFTRVWDQARRSQPGMVALDERWMRNQLADLELLREGASPHYRVLHETDTTQRDIVAITCKVLPPMTPGITPQELSVDDNDRAVLTRVVNLAEEAGKQVYPLVIPTNNPLYAIATAARDLKAKEVVMGRRHVDAATALSWGAVTAVAPAEGIEAAVEELVGQLVGGAPIAVKRLRSASV